MDSTGLGLCLAAGFDISGVEFLRHFVRQLIYFIVISENFQYQYSVLSPVGVVSDK